MQLQSRRNQNSLCIRRKHNCQLYADRRCKLTGNFQTISPQQERARKILMHIIWNILVDRLNSSTIFAMWLTAQKQSNISSQHSLLSTLKSFSFTINQCSSAECMSLVAFNSLLIEEWSSGESGGNNVELHSTALQVLIQISSMPKHGPQLSKSLQSILDKAIAFQQTIMRTGMLFPHEFCSDLLYVVGNLIVDKNNQNLLNLENYSTTISYMLWMLQFRQPCGQDLTVVIWFFSNWIYSVSFMPDSSSLFGLILKALAAIGDKLHFSTSCYNQNFPSKNCLRWLQILAYLANANQPIDQFFFLLSTIVSQPLMKLSKFTFKSKAALVSKVSEIYSIFLRKNNNIESIIEFSEKLLEYDYSHGLLILCKEILCTKTINLDAKIKLSGKICGTLFNRQINQLTQNQLVSFACIELWNYHLQFILLNENKFMMDEGNSSKIYQERIQMLMAVITIVLNEDNDKDQIIVVLDFLANLAYNLSQEVHCQLTQNGYLESLISLQYHSCPQVYQRVMHIFQILEIQE